MNTSILYLSNTPILGGTSRILQFWLQLGERNGLRRNIVLRQGSDFIDWARGQGVNVLVDPMPWPSRWTPWSVAWHAARVARWARRANVRLIHCNEHDIYPFVHVLKRFLNVPTVCHVRYKLGRPFAEWAFGGSRCPDVLLWTSQQQRSDSAEAIDGLIPEDRQHVISLGVDLEKFGNHLEAGKQLRKRWEIADDEIVVGIPSPLRPRKRIHDFVEMMRRLDPPTHNLVGVIAGDQVPGDEDYRAQIEQQIAESGLGRRLRWVGYLDPIEPFHHACDISVSTSEYETFGNSVCEAMACGKPVAAYRGGSVAEVVGDTGLIVDTGALDELTGAVARLAADANLRQSLGRQARSRVAAEFNPANSLRQLEGIYGSLLHDVETR